MVNIGDKLKILRAERDLTLDMLVADLNHHYPDLKIHKSMLSRWERGENDPSLEYAKVISVYFNVSLDWLIGLTDVRTPSRLLAKKQAHSLMSKEGIEIEVIPTLQQQEIPVLHKEE